MSHFTVAQTKAGKRASFSNLSPGKMKLIADLSTLRGGGRNVAVNRAPLTHNKRRGALCAQLIDRSKQIPNSAPRALNGKRENSMFAIRQPAPQSGAYALHSNTKQLHKMNRRPRLKMRKLFLLLACEYNFKQQQRHVVFAEHSCVLVSRNSKINDSCEVRLF